MKKSTKIFRIICLVLVSVGFLTAGIAKLTNNAQEAQMFSAVHLESTMMIIGVLEVLIAGGLWWKKTRTLAILLGTATLGAAFAETISLGMPSEVLAPGILLLLTWVIFYIDACHCHCPCEVCKNCTANKAAPTNDVM